MNKAAVIAAAQMDPIENDPKNPHQHLISCLVENHSGVLARIAGMITARGFNIDSLAVGTTHDKAVSRVTIAVPGDDRVVSQVIKQLTKIIDVIEIRDLSEAEHVERELMLIKVKCSNPTRSEIMQICDIFRGRIVDVDHDCLIIEVSGTTRKNDALMELFEPFGILEMTRTGRIALGRGSDVMGASE